MIRFAPLLLFIGLAGLLLLALGQQHGSNTQRGEEVSIPLAPLEVFTPLGKKTTLISNGHPMVVNFFASWCAPCIEDHAQLVALKHSYPALVIHGIAWNDTQENIDAWLAQHGNPFTALWYDTQGNAAMTLGVRGMPESYIVDAKGMVRYRVKGPISTELREEILAPLFERLAKQ